MPTSYLSFSAALIKACNVHVCASVCVSERVGAVCQEYLRDSTYGTGV